MKKSKTTYILIMSTCFVLIMVLYLYQVLDKTNTSIVEIGESSISLEIPKDWEIDDNSRREQENYYVDSMRIFLNNGGMVNVTIADSTKAVESFTGGGYVRVPYQIDDTVESIGIINKSKIYRNTSEDITPSSSLIYFQEVEGQIYWQMSLYGYSDDYDEIVIAADLEKVKETELLRTIEKIDKLVLSINSR